MPQSYYNATELPETAGLGLGGISNVCPSPLTPPPDQDEQCDPTRLHGGHQLRTRAAPSSDNTAAGMAQSQEDSIYLSPATTPEIFQDAFSHDEKDKMDIVSEECKDGTKTPMVIHTYESKDDVERSTSAPHSPLIPNRGAAVLPLNPNITGNQHHYAPQVLGTESELDSEREDFFEDEETAHLQGLAPVDLHFDRSIGTKPWTSSNRRLRPEVPSHVFQSFSRYSGTQQSDRQTYNVEVTILTVDMAQCTMSGYLLIKGLTPEHDTLQTYFTGEIIGGPSKFSAKKQYHTFRTANETWGATEKTDLTHWARFPAWRPLALHAKRDLNFDYPIDGGDWWQQDNIFMRWKEHFLVPDHKTKSIAGASFEGFYYICLNQIQGRISGIYYHSKSEKYQQLELKHEGSPDVFNRGVSPCIEFR